MKIVVDTGNGVAGGLAPRLFRALGCELVELFTEIDGNFPNHHPDPAHPENLQDVIRALKETDAEIGFAFDGDGDRLGVVTKDGQIIYPDRQLMLFAQEVLSRNKGAPDHLRREVHAQSRQVGARAGRRAADVEDRPFARQGEAARNRRAAGRRDERPRVLQGPLVRLRRRPVHRRAPARNPLARGRSEQAAERRCRTRTPRRNCN